MVLLYDVRRWFRGAVWNKSTDKRMIEAELAENRRMIRHACFVARTKLYIVLNNIADDGIQLHRTEFLVTLNQFIECWIDLVQTHGPSHEQYDREMTYAAARAVKVIEYCWGVRVDLTPRIESRRKTWSHSLGVQKFVEEMKQAVLQKELTT